MSSVASHVLVVAAIAVAIFGVTGRSSIAESASAISAAGSSAPPGETVDVQTLFGMNVPSLAALDASESAVGARSAIVGTFADWAHAPDFPTGLAEAINRRGAVPLISWEPWDWNGGAAQPAYALRRIVAGDYDTLIDRWAAEIAAYRHPVLLRFAPEMNGDWRPWSVGRSGNRAGDYVATWRHVRERFTRAGAANAIWVWNPIVSYDGSTPLRELFPGADQVDWLAVDGYNWGSLRGWGWQSYADIFAPTMRALHKLARHRPLMIAEAGSAPDQPQGGVGDQHLHVGTRRRLGGRCLVRIFQGDRLAPVPAPGGRRGREAASWLQGGDLTAVEQAVTRRR